MHFGCVIQKSVDVKLIKLLHLIIMNPISAKRPDCFFQKQINKCIESVSMNPNKSAITNCYRGNLKNFPEESRMILGGDNLLSSSEMLFFIDFKGALKSSVATVEGLKGESSRSVLSGVTSVPFLHSFGSFLY